MYYSSVVILLRLQTFFNSDSSIEKWVYLKNEGMKWKYLYRNLYSGTSLAFIEDTSLLRTPMFSPLLVISIYFDLCNRFSIRTAVVSPKDFLDPSVLGHMAAIVPRPFSGNFTRSEPHAVKNSEVLSYFFHLYSINN
jgi:hypothetical protein